MRLSALAVAAVVIACSVRVAAQAPRAADLPRTAAGKPDLTGVWQGGSTQPGNWEETNAGLGVGGSGRNPNAAVVGSSNDRPAGRAGAPYQDWAAKKVLEAFDRRGIDDPTGRCLPAGIPRSVMLGLFPQQFVQTPTQVVILYEYMNAYRVIPFAAQHQARAKLPRLRQHVRVFHRDLVVDSILADARVPLDDVQRVRVERAGAREPGLVVEARHVDDERIAVPARDRVAHVAR